jgi:hypothetical protein
LTRAPAILIAVALAAGCGPSHREIERAAVRSALVPEPPAPAWTVTGESEDHPRASHVVGLGRGTCQEAADNAARGEIAKVFEVRVAETTDQNAAYSETASAAGETWLRSADVVQAVRTEASRVLAGVEVVARHRGREGFVSLAALSRRKASDDLHTRAASHASRADRLVAEARKATDALDRARGYYQATLALVRLEVANRDLRVLGVRSPVEASARAADARAAFVEAVRTGVRFSLDVNGEDAARLKTALQSALTAAGVPVSEGPDARVAVTGSCGMRRNDRPPLEWVFVRYDLALTARDAKAGSVLAAAGPVSDDASGQTMDQALERAGFVVRSRHVEPFVRSVLDRLFGAGESSKEDR